MVGKYKLKKAKQTLFHVYKQFNRKRKKLDNEAKKDFENAFKDLQKSILEKNADEAKKKAHYLNFLSKEFLKKSQWEYIRDLLLAILFALLVAVAVRTMWFEFYEIPTGSMRPTLQEKDRLVVSKTAFGINIPLIPGHFYFNPDLIKRNGIFIFTGKNMDIPNVDTLYFYIFPGKKQYIKRLMGKSGDTVYFYGGKLYGIDQNGRDISAELNPPLLSAIDHVPYIYFEGKAETPKMVQQGLFSPVVLYQMNEPVAKMALEGYGKVQGEMLPPFQKIEHYYDLWGFRNYGMARILNKLQMEEFAPEALKGLSEAPLYMEILHHPNLSTAKLGRDVYGRTRPIIGLSRSYFPLQKENIEKIFHHIYTSRFVVKEEKAYRYGLSKKFLPFAIPLPHVHNGTYEFRDGKAYEIKWQGILKKLPEDHPLNQFSIYRTQLLYNIGMEFDTRFLPRESEQNFLPSRYVYFRDGDLYSMGAKIADKEDPNLQQFIAKEQQRQTGFIDYGAPLKEDGSLDIAFIKKYGVRIPDKHYLALGDNYAMSADSRDFGFVPENNIRGAPSLIFWPPGDRFGPPLQPGHPFLNGPRIIVWTVVALLIVLWYLYKRKSERLPIAEFQDKE
ncbi:MAG: signal peptidase I [Simkaniaceae bacterium]